MLQRSLNTIRGPIISAAELIQFHGQREQYPNLRVINSTCTRPFEDVDNDHYFLQRRIPNSTFIDIKEFVDKTDEVEMQAPNHSQFTQYMQELDVRNDDLVVFYDDLAIAGAARMWWLFQVYGIGAYVLDGGFDAWTQEGGEVETGDVTYQKRESRASHFIFKKPNQQELINFQDINALSYQITTNPEQAKYEIVDARGAPRFTGSAKEPREGIRSGNIPGSKNIPFTDLLDQKTKRFLNDSQIREVFEGAGVDLQKDVVTTCGSGVTACVLNIGLNSINQGDGQRRVYDGSWSEYGAKEPLSEAEVLELIEDKKVNIL